MPSLDELAHAGSVDPSRGIILMKLPKSFVVLAAVSALLSGCSNQDSTQPAENSISAGPKSDGALVKSRKAARPAPASKSP
jgi:hypothetical protein